jgi:hypothetical protein
MKLLDASTPSASDPKNAALEQRDDALLQSMRCMGQLCLQAIEISRRKSDHMSNVIHLKKGVGGGGPNLTRLPEAMLLSMHISRSLFQKLKTPTLQIGPLRCKNSKHLAGLRNISKIN